MRLFLFAFFVFVVVRKGSGEFNQALPAEGVKEFYPLTPGAASASDQVCP